MGFCAALPALLEMSVHKHRPRYLLRAQRWAEAGGTQPLPSERFSTVRQLGAERETDAEHGAGDTRVGSPEAGGPRTRGVTRERGKWTCGRKPTGRAAVGERLGVRG